MLQAQPELVAPIPVPIVAPPGAGPGGSMGAGAGAAGTSGSMAASAAAAIASAPAHGTLRIIQPGAKAAALQQAAAVSVADAAAGAGDAAASTSSMAAGAAARLSVTDVLNAIAVESGGHPIVRATDESLPPIRRPPIEIDSASIMLPRRRSNRVVIRGIIAAAVALVTAIVFFLLTR
jgi:hypothetical protein